MNCASLLFKKIKIWISRLPLGIPSLCWSFSKLLKDSRRACDIFWVVPGVRGGTCAVPDDTSINRNSSDAWISALLSFNCENRHMENNLFCCLSFSFRRGTQLVSPWNKQPAIFIWKDQNYYSKLSPNVMPDDWREIVAEWATVKHPEKVLLWLFGQI